MKHLKPRLRTAATAALTAALTFFSFQASPEDIDIFSVDESNIVARPNVLIVLDNSANWSRAAQQWPGGETQGESEASAIAEVLPFLDESVNVGLMEYIAGGAAADQDSAFVRFHIRPMTTDNKATLTGHLTTISANINDPNEKRPQSNPFGTLFWDVYNYLGGLDASRGGSGTVAALADGAGYTDLYRTFNSPLTTADTCTRTVVIFIGNNTSNGPSPDSLETSPTLDAQSALFAVAGGGTAGAAAIKQIPFADYAITTTNQTANLGFSNTCYASAAACTSAENTAACSADQGFLSCSCSSTAPIACPSAHWSVVGTKTTVDVVSDDTDGPDTGTSTGDIIQSCITTGTANGLNPTSCPANSDTTFTTGPGETTQTITTWQSGSCAYVDIGSTGCGSGRQNFQKQGTRTQQVIVRNTTSTDTPLTGETSACFNDAATCDTTGVDCSGYDSCRCDAPAGTSGCAAGNTFRFQVQGNYTSTGATQLTTFHAAPTGPFMMDEWARFLRQKGVPIPGGGARSQVTTYTIDVFNAQQHPDFSGLLFNAARVGGGKYFQARDKNSLINALKQIFTEVQAVNSAFSSASLPVNATNRAQNENQVFIGVFKPDRQKLPLWFGNLKRYQLISSGSTIDLGDGQTPPQRAINTQTGFITDCAVSFWTVDSTFTDSASVEHPYWELSRWADPLPEGKCTTNSTDDLSDLPDGPFVEKGAVAEVIRRGNAPGVNVGDDLTDDTDGNYALNRKVYSRTSATTAGAVPPEFTAAAFGTASSPATGLDDDLVNFIRGQDLNDEDFDSDIDPGTGDELVLRARTEPRQSIHGDVVHSRPQPLNYGGTTGVVVFYGSNDGHYRAVQATDGHELWSFVAPEHFSKLARLYKNDPIIFYFGAVVVTDPKDYFFDGSTGVYQTFKPDPADATKSVSDKTWIFPSMRRGGRMVYGLDVSNPVTPKYLWAKGCDAAGVCSTGFSRIGQTWSLPNTGIIKNYSTTKPVLVMGGGYDYICDDENSKSPCVGGVGQGVYVLDAETGTLLKHFDFSGVTGARGIAADVSLIDVDNDKLVDYGYAADTGGNVYRMDFKGTTKDDWTASKVAFTTGSSRKFLFTPALVQADARTVYLAIGTGDREHPLMSQYPFGDAADPSTAVINRFYVFKDLLTDTDATTATDLDSSTDMADYTSSTDCSSSPITPSSTKNGWFITLNENGQGEQVVTSAVIAAGFVFFSTNRPTPASTTACSTSLGEARGYFVNLLNGSGAIGVTGNCGGSRSSTFVGGGLPPSPVLATVPIPGVGLRTVVIGAVQKTGEPSSPIEAQRVRPPIPSHRTPIYWYKSTGDK